MRQGIVKINGIQAGLLQEEDGLYRFTYDEEYLANKDAQPVSMTLPLRKEPYLSTDLFPFFLSLLSEGANRSAQCSLLHLDSHDDFGLLLETAGNDTIGNVTIEKK